MESVHSRSLDSFLPPLLFLLFLSEAIFLLDKSIYHMAYYRIYHNESNDVQI